MKKFEECSPFFGVKGSETDTLDIEVRRYFIRSNQKKIIILGKILDGEIILGKNIKLVSLNNRNNFLEVKVKEIQTFGKNVEKVLKNKEVGILLGGISVEEMRFFNKICANQYYGISCEVG